MPRSRARAGLLGWLTPLEVMWKREGRVWTSQEEVGFTPLRSSKMALLAP